MKTWTVVRIHVRTPASVEGFWGTVQNIVIGITHCWFAALHQMLHCFLLAEIVWSLIMLNELKVVISESGCRLFFTWILTMMLVLSLPSRLCLYHNELSLPLHRSVLYFFYWNNKVILLKQMLKAVDHCLAYINQLNRKLTHWKKKYVVKKRTRLRQLHSTVFFWQF